MQPVNWNDLRYILAISRGRTLTAAARLLGVDDTTVARRLASFEAAMGGRLYQRLSNGSLQLTPFGERAALHAERVEREIGALGAALAGRESVVSGTVRVTSVPIVINRIFVPAAPALLKRHPRLNLEFIGDARAFSLTRREADMALRLARPKTGGTRVTARRIGTMHYAVYAAATCSQHDATKLPWVTYDEAMAHLPQARWIAATTLRNGGEVAAARVADAEALVEAVAAGLGRSLLPRTIADGDSRLRRLAAADRAPLPSRELWLLIHSDLKRLSRIEAVAEWIERIAPR